MGILKSSIRFSRNQHGEVLDIVRGFPRLLTYIIANLIYTFVMWVGMFLLIVPGAVWAIKYGFMNYLLVDTNMGIREAFAKSSQMTSGNKGYLFWWGIILITMIVVSIAPYFVGMKLFFGTWYNFATLTATQRVFLLPLGLGGAFVYPIVVSGKGYVYNKFYERFVK